MDSSKKNNLAQDLLYIGLIFVSSVLISLPLFKGQFICSSDYAGTLMRLLSMKQCLGHGQWVVRWVPELYRGCGYPVFNFYPPLFYILGVLIAKLGANIVAAVNLSLFIVLFLSGCTMYLFAREFWGRQGGFISAAAYLFAPYHMVSLYLRSAAAETAAYVFLPLILWSFYKLKQTSLKRYLVFSSLSWAGLLLTHNCASMILFPVVILYIFLLYRPSSYLRLISMLQGFSALALGTGLAAFFWLPAFVEKKFVHTELLFQGNLNFKNNFLTLKELLSPPWGRDMLYFREPHMFCQIGLAHGLIALIALLGFKRIVKNDPRLRAQILFFVALLFGAAFLALPYSRAVWEHVGTLQYLQFPFRFLSMVVLAVSFIAGGIVFLAGDKHRLKIAIVAVLVIFSANFCFYCHPWDTRKCDVKLIQSEPDKFLSELCRQDGGEYTPIWVKHVANEFPKFMQLQKLTALAPQDQVLDFKQISPLRYKFMVLSHHLSTFYFKSFYFPGWVVKVDGYETSILKDNPFGLIAFQCPEGIHNVEVYFGATPLRQTAQVITIVSLGLLVLVYLL